MGCNEYRIVCSVAGVVDSQLRESNPGLRGRTLGKFYHPTVLQFIQLYE